MPLTLRLEKGSPLTYQEMDANLTYLFSASINDTGSEIFSGSLTVTGSLSVTGSTKMDGTLALTGSAVISSSLIVIGTSVVTGSHNVTGSLIVKNGDGSSNSFYVSGSGFIGINTTTQTAGLEKFRVNGPLRTEDAIYLQDEGLFTWSPNVSFSVNAMANDLALNTVSSTKSIISSIAGNPIFIISSSGQIFSNYPIIQTGSIDVTGSIFQSGSLNVYATGSDKITLGHTASNTTNLGIVRIGQGNSCFDIGEISNSFPGIWSTGTGVTNTTTNYRFSFDVNTTYVNGPSSVNIMTAGGNRHTFTATGLKLGSTSNPSVALDVFGNGAISGSLTVSSSIGLIVTGSVTVSPSGSFTLPTTASFITPQTGSMFFSGSYIWVHNGVRWMSASLA